MIYAVYIAAAAAVGLLIGLVMLSISWLRKAVTRNIRSRTIDLLSVYDELLEQKSQQLADMDAEALERTEEKAGALVKEEKPLDTKPEPLRASELLNMAERSGGAMYRDGAMGSVYSKIRGSFSFQLEQLLPALSSETEFYGGPAGKLLAALDYDTVYRLSTMRGEDQISILQEVLSGEQRVLLEDYLQTHEKFQVLNFYDSLRALAEAEPKPARLWVPAGVVADKTERNGVEILTDEEICEGFLLEEDNLLYDYCLKARELS